MGKLSRRAVQTAHTLRRGQTGFAGQLMVELSEALGELRTNDTGLPTLLRHLLSAQGSGDWLLVADLLEHELAPWADRLPEDEREAA